MAEKTDTEKLNEIISGLQKTELLHKLFMEMGANLEQAAVAAESKKIAGQFEWNGAILTFHGEPIYKNKQLVQDWLKQEHYDFLLPPPDPNPIAALRIDAALLKSARSGNKTSQGQVFRQAGSKEAYDAVMAAETTTDDANEGAHKTTNNGYRETNPWSAGSWNPRAQISAVKGLGLAKASEIAAGATPPSFVGATKPGAVNYTSNRRAG